MTGFCVPFLQGCFTSLQFHFSPFYIRVKSVLELSSVCLVVGSFFNMPSSEVEIYSVNFISDCSRVGFVACIWLLSRYLGYNMIV